MLGVWSLIIWEVMWLYSLSYAFASVVFRVGLEFGDAFFVVNGFSPGFLASPLFCFTLYLWVSICTIPLRVPC